MTTVAPDARPVTIGLAITALHVMHIVEYCEATGVELDHLLAQDAPASPRTIPWIRRTCDLLGTAQPVVGRFVLTSEDSSVAEDHEIVERLLAGQEDRPLRIVSGGFHLPYLWFLVEKYADRIESLVLVDEGVGTFSSPIGDRNLVPEVLGRVGSSDLRRAFEAFAEVPAVFYSHYPLTTQLRPIDTLVPADPAVLPRMLHVDGPQVSDTVFFVGSPLHFHLTDARVDAELTSLAVHFTRRLHPGAEVVYVPHRDEQAEKLRALETLVEVRPLDHPIELEGLASGVVPKRLATFSSTAAISCGMIDGDLRVDVFPVPEEHLREPYVESYRAVRALFEELLQERVAFHDVEPASWSLAADDALPVGDVTVVLGSDGEAAGQPTELALEQASALVSFARGIDPACRVLYVAEHGESAAKCAELGAAVEVEQRALPTELLPHEWGLLPRHVVTMRGSALGTLVDGRRGRVTGWVLRPAPTGYYEEEAALEAAHEAFRARPDADLHWEELPAKPVPAEEALLTTQRHYTRDVQALRARLAEVEQEADHARTVSAMRHVQILKVQRQLQERDQEFLAVRERFRLARDRNEKLRATRKQLQGRVRALEEERARRLDARIRRLLGRLRRT
ncbi:hypothetical protein [Nocardioides sp. CER19]|uniref:hypothetical protein n=1 Tax=Nocardioides sp. CER19 TaxID=3038538 RepID=UPI002449EFF1|nr:hypothetical protein [Nocardioides sp. CER19]MDH2413528.1 hypothetical protein [Nocardioides sp. CER19]